MLVGLHMAWNGFLPFPIRPDIMFPAVAKKPPANWRNRFSNSRFFYSQAVHLLVYYVKN